MLRYLIAVFAVSGSLAGPSGCGAPTPAKQEAAPPKVVCQPAVEREVTDYEVLIGRTEAAESVEVRARVSGYIQSIEFEDGAMVEKGQLLAKIEPDEYQAIYDQFESQIDVWQAKKDLAQTNFNRAEELIQKAAISKEEYEQDVAALKEAEAQIVAAQANLKRAELDLKYTEIRAPIGGHIDRALITEGNLVSGGLGSGTMLTRIVNDSPTYAYLQVDEQTWLRLTRKIKADNEELANGKSLADQKIPCFLQLQDETEFSREGILDFIENQIDAATGSIRIRARFKNEDGLLRSGLFVRGKVPTGKPYQTVTIPEQSIAREQSSRYVFVVGDDNKAERRQITVGKRIGDQRVVLEGLNANETVIVQGVQRVRPGMKVQVEKLKTE